MNMINTKYEFESKTSISFSAFPFFIYVVEMSNSVVLSTKMGPGISFRVISGGLKGIDHVEVIQVPQSRAH